jgi:hypothetical protein
VVATTAAGVVALPIAILALVALPIVVLFGIPFALLQGWALRLNGLLAPGWRWATFAGWWAGWVVGLALIASTLPLPRDALLVRVMPYLAAAVAGWGLGHAQRFMLRDRASRNRWWIAASSAGVVCYTLAANLLGNAGCASDQLYCHWSRPRVAASARRR